MILVYIALTLLFLYYLVTKNHSYWESKGVPFEKPFLFFGNFYSVIKGKQPFAGRVREIYEKYDGPYVGIHVFTQPSLMVRSPELLKKILVKDFDKFVNRPIASNEKVDPIAFHTLFSSKDTTWRNLRAKISPVFTSGKMKLMLPLIKECTEELRIHLRQNGEEVLETKKTFKRFTVDVISTCAFGIKAYSIKDENSEILKMANQLLDLNSLYRNFSIFSFFFAPSFVNIFRLTFVDKAATDYFISAFDKTMKERKKLRIERNDLIDMLYGLKKNENFGDKYTFDDMKMAAQAIAFFSAGNDTTASILAFASYELAIDKEIQTRLREELKENCDQNGDFTYEDLHKLKYLDMVLKETHRKYPLTTFLSREVATDYTFEETGLKLQKGDQIFVPLAGLQYDPKIYPEPDKFNPDRFSDENKSSISHYTYMPFGEGPRVCIGERFANLVAKVALAYVIKDFQVETTPSTPIPLELSTSSLFLQSKKGLFLKFVEV